VSAVTAIKPQKSFGKLRTGSERVNIYLDGKFGFGLDLENFVKLGLKVGQKLSEEDIEKIKGISDRTLVLSKLLSFAMLRPRSEREINDWFKRKKVDEKIHNYLFDRLKHFDLLNDEKFAKWWVEQRLNFKSKSKKELVYELRGKGIKKEIIDNVLEDTDIDEEKTAKKLIEKRKYKWERFDEKTRRQKISVYLASKGFDWNVISKVIQ